MVRRGLRTEVGGGKCGLPLRDGAPFCAYGSRQPPGGVAALILELNRYLLHGDLVPFVIRPVAPAIKVVD
jgi:hypothetical protein